MERSVRLTCADEAHIGSDERVLKAWKALAG
jgi:hypothetical protein